MNREGNLKHKRGYSVVFDDESIVVIDKIAKLLVHPSPKKEKITFLSILEKDLKMKVFPCHRLDRETTGLLIFAKDALSQSKLMRQFQEGRVKKKYAALVRGVLRKKKGIIEGEIIDKEGKRFNEKKRYAKVFYRVIAQAREWSYVELEPVTGRTNQLRIQLASIEHPILGERKYAFRRDFKVDFKRLALHAFYLSFTHPLSGYTVVLKVGLPVDMREFLADG
jgi:23S rRNA pseudouridine1911/1915/1917 synthase